MDKLPGDYISGFIDGEGCFALKFRRDVRHERKNKPVYFYWDIEFAIVLRKDDQEIIEKIKKTLDCGRISLDKRGMVRFAVNDLSDLLYKIVPFFEKYQLRAKKRFDFNLWKKAVLLLYNNKGLMTGISTTGNLKRQRKNKWDRRKIKILKDIYEAMKKYKGIDRQWKWINKV